MGARRLLIGVALSASVLAQEGSEGQKARAAKKLARRAVAEREAAKAGWDKFVLSPKECTDKELMALATRYEAAIDLYQRAEESGVEGVGPAIVLLARRVAGLRATLFWRDMERKRNASAKESKAADPPEAPKGKGEKGDHSAGDDPAPPIVESPAQRARNIQSARNLVIGQLRYRRRSVIAPSCRTCGGDGEIQPPRQYDPKTNTWGPWPPPYTCSACAGRGQHFNGDAAVRALWWTRTPLTRGNAEAQRWWESWQAYWAEKPSAAPWLKRIKIRSVDYHGLWADVTWQEWGSQGLGIEKTRRLIRIGRRWYFYTPAYDSKLYALG
jgi:hypothetical protein